MVDRAIFEYIIKILVIIDKTMNDMEGFPKGKDEQLEGFKHLSAQDRLTLPQTLNDLRRLAGLSEGATVGDISNYLINKDIELHRLDPKLTIKEAIDGMKKADEEYLNS